MSTTLNTRQAPGEAETVEGRLADIIEKDGEVWVGPGSDGYQLSKEDLVRVVAALLTIAGPRSKHLKRGSVVTEIARGFAQVAHHPIEEMTAVVIYRHDEDGLFWVRNAVEFDDGRFVAVTQDKRAP